MPASGSSALRTLLLAALGMTLAAAPVAAQEQGTIHARESDDCICVTRAAPARITLRQGLFGADRARIGVYLGEAEDVDGRGGVRVLRVVDRGPAHTAGIRAGDVITDLDGEPLGDEPGVALTDAMRDVEPGDTVAVTFYREGSPSTVDVVTDEATGFGLLRSGNAFDLRLSPATLQLVELNPALGEYFGTDRGVLVIAVGSRSTLGLRPGDVILAIDGRDVHDAAHVRAILGSYRADEEVTLRIVRRDAEMEVTGTARG